MFGKKEGGLSCVRDRGVLPANQLTMATAVLWCFAACLGTNIQQTAKPAGVLLARLCVRFWSYGDPVQLERWDSPTLSWSLVAPRGLRARGWPCKCLFDAVHEMDCHSHIEHDEMRTSSIIHCPVSIEWFVQALTRPHSGSVR